MTDFDSFERRFAIALRSDADRNVGSFDAGSIARDAIDREHSRRGVRSLRRGGGRGTPRRMWLLVAATLVIGASVLGAALVGSLRNSLTPKPTLLSVVTDASPSPGPSQTASASLNAARPAQAGQFDEACDFGLGSATVGWISTKSALYRTEDLGETWSAVQPQGWSAATGVANLFIDADTAYSFLSGSTSTVAATHDGGATWVETALGGKDAWPVFSFQTPSRGFLIFYGALKTDPVSIYDTIDGGLTWTGPQSATTIWAALMPEWCAHREPLGTLEQTQSWVDYAPHNGSIQLSRDAGVTWTQRPVPAGGGRGPWGGGLWGDDSGRLVLWAHPEGPPPGNDLIYRSDDDGQSWQVAADLRPGGRNPQFLSISQWIVYAGDGSSVASTVDGGAHWRTVVGGSTFAIGWTSWASPDVGWVAALCGPNVFPPDPPTHPACDPTGVRPLLLQTTDGGRTWTTIGQ
jgi:photosystem II stability/assembly factor-like uncharacterized protein